MSELSERRIAEAADWLADQLGTTWQHGPVGGTIVVHDALIADLEVILGVTTCPPIPRTVARCHVTIQVDLLAEAYETRFDHV